MLTEGMFNDLTDFVKFFKSCFFFDLIVRNVSKSRRDCLVEQGKEFKIHDIEPLVDQCIFYK